MRRTAALAACVLAVAASAVLSARPSYAAGGASTGTAAPAGPPPGPAAQGQTAGMAIPDISGASPASVMAHLKSDGINTVSLFVWWLAPSRTGSTLAPYQGTTSDAALVNEIQAARRLGLRVTLTPLFYCADCEGGWRGTMAPENVNAFFAAYGSFIGHYAAMAQQEGVSTLFVGSEMTSLETDTSQWERVISSVRHSFSGSLAYEENWDVVGRARFLGDVDLIGVSSYFPLDDSPAPTLAQLRADWSNSHASATYGSNWVAVLDQLAASTHKPIVFGEAGYMSGDYAAKQPFLNFEGQPDWQLQSDLYQALLETFSAKPWWSGAVWWEWGNPDGAIPDAGRSPGGKTAELLLQRWYAQGQRPANPDTPLVLAGGPGSSGGGISAAGVGTPVGATGAVSAGAGSTAAGRSAARAGLDAAQRAGLMAVVALLIALGTACWFTLGRAPTRSAPAAFATYRPPRRARGR